MVVITVYLIYFYVAEIYEKVKNGLKPYFRPNLDECDCPCDELAHVIRQCWKEDPMERVYYKADQMSEMYKNDPYWQSMKVGCDAIRSGSISQVALEQVEHEHSCWGPAMSNKAILGKVLENLKKCEVV